MRILRKTLAVAPMIPTMTYTRITQQSNGSHDTILFNRPCPAFRCNARYCSRILKKTLMAVSFPPTPPSLPTLSREPPYPPSLHSPHPSLVPLPPPCTPHIPPSCLSPVRAAGQQHRHSHPIWNYGRREDDRSRRERSRERGRSLERSPRRPERSPRRPAFRADLVPLAPDRRGEGAEREGRGGFESVGMGSDPWRTDARHGAGGDHGHRQDTGAYRSPEEGYRRREDRSRGRGLEEFFSGRQGDLDVDGEDEADTANKAQETNREGEAKGDDEAQEEGAGEQREMPAGVKEADSTQAGAAAEPSAAKPDGTNGAWNQPRGEEKNDGGRRSSGPRSPNPRQHRDEKRGGEGRVPDLRQHRDVGRGDGALASGQRQHRDGGHAGGARSPDPRPQHDERREGGYRSPDPRSLHEERRGSSYRSPDPRQRHAKVAIARLTRDGTMEGGGEVRRARQIGVSDTRKAREADTARRRGSGAGMEGRALGLARLGGIGSVTKDVPVKEDRINAAAEWEAAG
ncbi:unnamed protein product [Closterium sp. NIES-65]|nr:unnamed protein product [Closterium sp. NIES-65]